MSDCATIGVVGAGNMGRGIAASLARSGMKVLQYDRDAAALATSVAQSELISAAPSLGALCGAHEMVVVSVAGEAAERAVFLGPGGLFEHATGGSLFVGCGTISVGFACACALKAPTS